MRAALLALGAAALLAGCGGGHGAAGQGTGALTWSGEPTLFTPETLPGDRILTGRLRNASLRRVRVNLPDVRSGTRPTEIRRWSTWEE